MKHSAFALGFVFSLMSFMQTSPAFADTQSVTALTGVGVDNGNYVIIHATESLPGMGCGAQGAFPKDAMFALTNDYTKAMYSTAMAAYLAGKKVYLFMNGCNPLGYPLLTRIDVFTP
jgi:hypothetical protein